MTAAITFGWARRKRGERAASDLRRSRRVRMRHVGRRRISLPRQQDSAGALRYSSGDEVAAVDFGPRQGGEQETRADLAAGSAVSPSPRTRSVRRSIAPKVSAPPIKSFSVNRGLGWVPTFFRRRSSGPIARLHFHHQGNAVFEATIVVGHHRSSGFCGLPAHRQESASSPSAARCARRRRRLRAQRPSRRFAKP